MPMTEAFLSTEAGIPILATIDPKDHFRDNGAKQDQLIEALGFLPAFMCDGSESMIKNLVGNYAYFWGWTEMTGSLEEEVFCHPEDPPLYPIARFVSARDKILIYQYSIVVWVDANGNVLWSRFD